VTPEVPDFFEDEWEYDDEPTAEELTRSVWRGRVIWVVAAITVAAMALVPLYNLVNQGQRPVADNGLEVCGFDYCQVQDGIRAAGLDGEMSRLSNFYLSDEDASRLAAELVAWLGEDPVAFEVVDRLDWRIKGQYTPATRTIRVERPVSAWIVLHEVAHVPAQGHGDGFLAALVRLVGQVSGP
jgi:hypothetical protein